MWMNGKRSFVRSVAICLAVTGAAFAAAQETPKTQVPAPRTIILPQRVVASEPASLAVLDASGHLVPNIAVEISGGQKVTTDATGRAMFIAPHEIGVVTAKISGLAILTSSPVVTPQDSPAQNSAESPPAGVRILSYPHFIMLHNRFTIEVSGFRGAAEANSVFLSDQPCLVLASSPVSLVVLPGLHIPLGPVTLRASVEGRDAGPIPVAAVQLEFSGPAEGLNAGGHGNLTVRVRGTEEPLAIEVRNASPRIIQLSHGNVQRVTSSGGEQNIAQAEVKFLAAGDYVVTARLISR
jgi:hypothetical protein